jgi:hypothetical protein
MGSLTVQELLVMGGIVVVVAVTAYVGIRLVLRAGKLALRMGCTLLLLSLLLVVGCLGWLVLTGRLSP